MRHSQVFFECVAIFTYFAPQNDPDDPNGPDLETKIDEIRDIIRRSETEKAKAEGVLECLRDGDVNVDEWIQDIENLTTVDMARSSSSTSIKTNDSRVNKPYICENL
jgi:exonuclease III